ncbi:hypothetical protein F8566_19040 [Actinomadura rudentiformis]|uniref:Uncharacterized protein n=1 Tax=Actinomadura rudentiformis TaxID=359158 RepID=A0A6H9YUB0_9ACTN|nr:hypothetical protein F8566_19040 [Actinomadura rudentiformis]
MTCWHGFVAACKQKVRGSSPLAGSQTKGPSRPRAGPPPFHPQQETATPRARPPTPKARPSLRSDSPPWGSAPDPGRGLRPRAPGLFHTRQALQPPPTQDRTPQDRTPQDRASLRSDHHAREGWKATMALWCRLARSVLRAASPPVLRTVAADNGLALASPSRRASILRPSHWSARGELGGCCPDRRQKGGDFPDGPRHVCTRGNEITRRRSEPGLSIVGAQCERDAFAHTRQHAIKHQESWRTRFIPRGTRECHQG